MAEDFTTPETTEEMNIPLEEGAGEERALEGPEAAAPVENPMEEVAAEAPAPVPEEVLAEISPTAETAPAEETPAETDEGETPPEEEGPPAYIKEVEQISVQETLAQAIGRYISSEFFIGDRNPIRREGLLLKVGCDYFILQENGAETQMVCSLHHAKFVTVHEEDFLPPPRQHQGWANSAYPGQVPGLMGAAQGNAQGNRRPYRR